MSSKSATIHLYSLHQVRKEMCAVYNDVRSGQITHAEGAKLTYMLMAIVKANEIHHHIFADERQFTYDDPTPEQKNVFTRTEP